MDKWSQADFLKLLELAQEKPRKTWEEIGTILGKKPNACRMRWRHHAQDAQLEHANVQFKADHNHAEVDGLFDRITTPEQLLEYCRIDLNEWIVERTLVNKYEMGRRNERKHLVYASGVVSGEVCDEGGIAVETLWQVKVWLVKRKPEPIEPVLQPMLLSLPLHNPPLSVKAGVRCALVLADAQFGYRRDFCSEKLFPFHDRRALDIALQVAENYQPDTIIYLGDWLDLSDWSDKYLRSPEFTFLTQPAIIEAAWWMGQFRSILPESYQMKLEGNHEKRLDDSMINHLQAAYHLYPADQLKQPLLSIERLLGLKSLGITYHGQYPNNEVWLTPHLVCTHGEVAQNCPGATSRKMMENATVTKIFGHIHRREYLSKTLRDAEGYHTVSSFCPGCLCMINGIVPGSSRDNQWQQGVGLIWFDEQDCSIQPIEINNGRAIVEGRVFTARDRLEALRQDTGLAL